MSRHRNVRSMDYSEEYEGFDDVYGHSVEDDYCVSPSVAEQFIYDRNKRSQMSAFLGQEEEIAEEDEEEEEDKQSGGVGVGHNKSTLKGLNLNDIDQARLQSCLEEVRNVIGDSITEQTLVDAVLSCDFNVEKALNLVLNNAAGKDPLGALKPMKAEPRRDKDDCLSCNSYSSPRDRGDVSEHCLEGKELKVPEKGDSEVIVGSIESFSSQKASDPLEISEVGIMTEASAKSDSVLADISSKTECQVSKPMNSHILPCNMSSCELKKEPNNESHKKLNAFLDTSTEKEMCLEMEHLSIPSVGDSSNSQIAEEEVFQPDLKLPSDSEEEDFSSLCSLVIHNRSGSSEYSTKLSGPVSSMAVCASCESGKDLGEYSSPSKPVGSSGEPSTEIGSDSEEEDFSSLCSLVIHNRSASKEYSTLVPGPGPSTSVPTLHGQGKNLDGTSPPHKVLGFSNEPFGEHDSDSEDDNFSSLCSLVIRNRTSSSEVSTKFPSKVPLASVPTLHVSTKTLEECSSHSKPVGFSIEPINELGSDSEEDTFSSLCSLVIHNRNSSSEASTKLLDPVSLVNVPTGKDTDNSQTSNEPNKEPNLKMNKFIIPPLVIPAKLRRESETVGEASGLSNAVEVDISNQCSEDEDYVIDLCSTLKSMEIKKSPSVEEENASHIVETIPYEFLTEDNVFTLSMNESGVSNSVKGLNLLDLTSTKISPFGRILCRKWECLVRTECPQSQDESVNVDVVAFLFDNESPDDICRRLRSQKYLVKVETAKIIS